MTAQPGLNGRAPVAAATGPALAEVIRRLRELIAALDRRAPRTDGVAEVEVVRVASVLRSDAVKGLAELERLLRLAASPEGTDAR